MENRLATESDIKRSEELHMVVEAAERERTRRLVGRDRLQEQLEDARIHLHCADALLVGSPQTRIEALKADCARLELERDRATAAAEEPYLKVLARLREHDGKFFSAATGWLSSVRKAHDFDSQLGEYIESIRTQFHQMLPALAPLRAAVELFNVAVQRIENWKLAEPPQNCLVTGKSYPRWLQLPRLQDWLR